MAGQAAHTDDQDPVDFILLLTTDDRINERIDVDEFADFVKAGVGVVDGWAAHNAGSGLQELQVARALLPERQLLCDFQTGPEELDTLPRVGMTAVLQELPRPDVRSGPVIFARRIRLKAFNGATNCGLTFSSLVACRQNYWFNLLYNAAVAGHAAGVRSVRTR